MRIMGRLTVCCPFMGIIGQLSVLNCLRVSEVEYGMRLVITLETHFLRSSLSRMITLGDYKLEPCITLEDRRISSDGTPSANRNETQTFNFSINLNINNLNILSLVTFTPPSARTYEPFSRQGKAVLGKCFWGKAGRDETAFFLWGWGPRTFPFAPILV